MWHSDEIRKMGTKMPKRTSADFTDWPELQSEKYGGSLVADPLSSPDAPGSALELLIARPRSFSLIIGARVTLYCVATLTLQWMVSVTGVLVSIVSWVPMISLSEVLRLTWVKC